jgi:hypothetical protein
LVFPLLNLLKANISCLNFLSIFLSLQAQSIKIVKIMKANICCKFGKFIYIELTTILDISFYITTLWRKVCLLFCFETQETWMYVCLFFFVVRIDPGSYTS